MLKLHAINLKRLHLDTNAKSVQGIYESEANEEFGINHTHSLDMRQDLKQYTIGCAIEQTGLPVMGDLLPGNHPDAQWNPLDIQTMNSFYEKKDLLEIT